MSNIKYLYIALCSVFLGTSCSKEDTDPLVNSIWDEIKTEYISNQTVCSGLAPDRIVYPVPYTAEVEKRFEIPDETVTAMSTCGLLDSYLNFPPRVLGPWCHWCSFYPQPLAEIYWFADKRDKVVVELISREDCIRIISERYANMVHTRNMYYYGNDDPHFHGWKGVLQCFEMLIASNIFLEKLNEREMKNFMVMALKVLEIRNKNTDELGAPFETRHIMANIMLASKFEPFLEEFGVVEIPGDTYFGYTICSMVDDSGIGIVEKYARQYLKNF